jgi:hypothetical protein
MMHIRVHFYNDESRINQTGVLIHEFTDSDILVPSRRSPLKGTGAVLRRDRGQAAAPTGQCLQRSPNAA